MVRRVQFKSFSVLLICMAVIILAVAGKNAFGAETVKIGYVDLRTALIESEAGKKVKAEMETLVKTKQAAIEEKGKAIEKQKAELEKQAAVLSPEAKKAREDDIERQIRDYQRVAQDAQAELKKKDNELSGTMYREIKEIIEKVGQEEGYSVILENFEGMILYARKDLDVTDKVIKRYNESKTAQKKEEPKSKSQKK